MIFCRTTDPVEIKSSVAGVGRSPIKEDRFGGRSVTGGVQGGKLPAGKGGHIPPATTHHGQCGEFPQASGPQKSRMPEEVAERSQSSGQKEVQL